MVRQRYGKVVYLTGALSGIGKTIALALSEQGFHVYGITRKADADPLTTGFDGGFIKILRADVTDPDSIKRSVDSVIQAEGRVDIAVNCAGFGIAGAVEDTTADEAKAQMETNFIGVLNVVRAVLPHMRKAENGLIINISSFGGLVSLPFQAMYSASKYALEAMTLALRLELKPFNVRAALVEPGDIRTGFTDARLKTAESGLNEAYKGLFKNALGNIVNDERNGQDPDVAAKTVLKIIGKKRPRARNIVSVKYKILYALIAILPFRILEFVLERMYMPEKRSLE